MDGSVQTRQRWQDAPAAGVTAVVLGMHRSGTSCLVQILKACGMHFDDAGCQPLPNNMEGFGESQEALAINDMILARSGGAWDRVPEKLQLDPEILQRMKGFVAGLRRARSVSIVSSENVPADPMLYREPRHAEGGDEGRFEGDPNDGPAFPLAGRGGPANVLLARVRPCSAQGWKDPRTVLTFPLWKPLITPYRIVACFRHPASVAKSLAVRDGMTMEDGYALWAAYNERLLEHLRDEPRVLWFDFDRTPEDIDSWLDNACRALNLTRTPEAVGVFNKFEQHHRIERTPLVPRLSAIYQELVRRAREANAGGTPAPQNAGGTPALQNDSTAQRRPFPTAFPAADEPADAAPETLRRDLAALANVVTKQNAFLQAHARELDGACRHRGRLDAQLASAMARINQLEYDLQMETAALRAKLAQCDGQLQSILGSRVWRSYQRLQRARARLGKFFAVVWKRTRI